MSGSVRSVILDLIGRDNASRAFLSASTNANKAATAFERSGYRMQASGAKMQAVGHKMTKGFTLPLLAVGALAVKTAADYDKSLNTIAVATDTSEKQMRILSGGIKDIATTTGTSLHQLTDGAYTIQKSTHSATQTLQILSAAAKGAKAENADLGVVTNALTSVMASYGLKGDKAVSTTNMLIRGAGLAKTTLQDFASSLSSVVPLASSLNIKIPEIFGAIATMTQHGESPQQAAQNLNSLISSLAGGSNVMVRALQQLKVPVLDFQKNLGKRGVSGTLQFLLDKMKASSSGGMIVYKSFKQAALGVSSMDIMMDHLTGQAKKNAVALRTGKLGIGDYRTAAKGMADGQSNMALQFLAAFQAQTGFNDLLKSGRGNTQTYARALLQAVGGITNMGAVLKLLGPEFIKTGKASDLYLTSIHSVAKAGKDNLNISGWDKTLKLFSTQWDVFKSTLQVDLVNLGTKLMPVAMSMLNVFKGVYNFLAGIGKVIGPSASKWLLLAAAMGPLLSIGGRLVRTYGAVFLALGRLSNYRAGFRGINNNLAQMNTGAYQAGARMRGVNAAVRGFGAALSGIAIGGVVGSMVKAGGIKGWLESVLGAGVAGAAGGSMFGPLGTAIGGVTSMISGGISHWLSHKAAAKDALQAEKQWVDDLSASIRADNGLIGDMTKNQINNKLSQNGTLKQANNLLGPGHTGDVLNAASGGDAKPFNFEVAMAKAPHQAALDRANATLNSHSDAFWNLNTKQWAALMKTRKAEQDQINTLDDLSKAVLGETADAKKAAAQERLRFKTFEDSRLKTGDYGAQLSALKKKTSEAVDEQGNLTGSLKAGTIAGDHNRQVLSGLATAAKQDAAAVFRQTRQHQGYKAAVAASRATLAAHAAQIIAAATAAHMNAKQVAALINDLLGLGKQHPKPKVSVDDKASPKLHNIHDIINGIPRDVNINVTATANDVGKAVHDAVNSIPSSVTKHHARGGGVADGWFTVGEQGYELGHKQGNKVQIFSNSQSKKMTGMNKVPGFASGTGASITHQGKDWVYNGIRYASERAARNAQTRAQQSADKKAKENKPTKAELRGGSNTLYSTYRNANSSASEVRSAVSALIKLAKSAGVATAGLQSLGTRMGKLASRRDKLRAQLGSAPQAPTAWDHLTQLRADKKSESDNIRSTFNGTFSAASAGTREQVYNDKPAPKMSAGTILADLRKAAANGRKFANLLVKLGKMGLPSFMLRQLAEAGPEALPQAVALASSTKAQMAAFRQQGKILDNAGKRAGAFESGNLYDAQITRAKARVESLQKRIARLTARIKSLGERMDKKFRRETHLNARDYSKDHPHRKHHKAAHHPPLNQGGFSKRYGSHHPHPHPHPKHHPVHHPKKHPPKKHHKKTTTDHPTKAAPHFVINVHPSANMDEKALAAAVGRRVRAHLGAM